MRPLTCTDSAAILGAAVLPTSLAYNDALSVVTAPPVASETPAHCCGRWQPATGSPLRISKPPSPPFWPDGPDLPFPIRPWDLGLFVDRHLFLPPKTKSDQRVNCQSIHPYGDIKTRSRHIL